MVSGAPLPVVPGQCYATPFGAAIVLSAAPPPPAPQIYQCYLWRRLKESVGSCATAYLNQDCFGRELAGMVGQEVVLAETSTNDVESAGAAAGSGADKDTFIIEAHDAISQTYSLRLSSPPSGEVARKEPVIVPESALLPARSTRIYPLLHYLIGRADELNSTISPIASPMVNSAVKVVKRRLSDNYKREDGKPIGVNSILGAIEKVISDDVEKGDEEVMASNSASTTLFASSMTAASATSTSLSSSNSTGQKNANDDLKKSASILKTLTDAEATSSMVTSNTTILHEKAKSSLDLMENVLNDKVLKAPEEARKLLDFIKQNEVGELLAQSRDRLSSLVNSDLTSTAETMLNQNGIEINLSDTVTAMSGEVREKRELALQAIEKLRAKSKSIKNDASSEEDVAELVTAWDSLVSNLTTAGGSDASLGKIVNELHEKGKSTKLQSIKLFENVQSTRSVTTLFDGATKLRERASSIFAENDNSRRRLSEAKSSFHKFTSKADNQSQTLGMIKTLELTEAVKRRLVFNFELHADARGGIDGLIYSSFNKLNKNQMLLKGKMNDEYSVEKIVAELQHKSDMVREKTNKTNSKIPSTETLIGAIGKGSAYKDVVLSALESQLVVLNDRARSFGVEDLFSPENIAQLRAGGSDNTQALFKPLIAKASSTITAEIDAANEKIENPSIKLFTGYLRSIATGEKSLDGGIVDDLMTGLNSDDANNLGQSLLLRGDRILDSYENLSKKEMFKGAIAAISSAGLTEESIVQQISNLDVNTIVETSEKALTSEEERVALFSSATDSALDFILRVLPGLPVPPLTGVKDGTCYSFSNLSLRGFQVRKEDVAVKIAGVMATGAGAGAGAYYNDTSSVSSESNSVNSNSDHTPLARPPQPSPPPSRDTKIDITEILVVEVKNITAVLDNVKWTFEQTFFPHMKAAGSADAKCFGASLVLKFELRKKPTPSSSGTSLSAFSPILCLHEHSCSIDDVKVKIKGDSLSWLLNILSSMFKSVLKDYVVASVIEAIQNSSGTLLEMLNGQLHDHWPMVLKLAKLTTEELMVADADAISDTSSLNKDVELVWRESVPLGMQLLLNDKVEKDRVKVVEFPRGGQARRVAEAAGFDPDSFRGSQILAVNGSSYKQHQTSKNSPSIFDETMADLKNPSRPKAILFRLSAEEGKRIAMLLGRRNSTDESSLDQVKIIEQTIMSAVIEDPGPLGISFHVSNEAGLVVAAFKKKSSGEMLPAEASGQVHIGEVLVSINNRFVTARDKNVYVKKTSSLFTSIGDTRPLVLGFVHPSTLSIKFTKSDMNVSSTAAICDQDEISESVKFFDCPSLELKLSEARVEESDKHTVCSVAGFEDVPGVIEMGGCRCGDVLLSINGEEVGTNNVNRSGDVLKNITKIIGKDESYPLRLEFARPVASRSGQRSRRRSSKQAFSFDLKKCSTFLVTVLKRPVCGLGIRIDTVPAMKGKSGMKFSTYLYLSSFELVKGNCARRMAEKKVLGMSIYKINESAVPTTASVLDVTRAIQRAWDGDKKVTIRFRNEEHYRWYTSLN